MAGLCCGEPCSIAWDILKDYADHFVSIPDYVSAKGMKTLAWPIGNDQKVVSGESGAATLGLVVEIKEHKKSFVIKFEKSKDNLNFEKNKFKEEDYNKIISILKEKIN